MSGNGRRTRELSLPPAATSPQEARRFATALLDEWELGALSNSVEFIVSELVTNAALHAQTDIEVLLTRLPTGVRVEVRDQDNGGVLVPMALPPPARSVLDATDDPDDPGSPHDLDALEALLTAEATTGRGLRLVAGLATDWGVDRLSTGKAVWAEVHRDGSPRDGSPRDSSPRDGSPRDSSPRDGSPRDSSPRDSSRRDSSPRDGFPRERAPETRPGAVGAPAEGRVVRLIAVPVRLALESDLQLDALVREFQVMASGGFTRTGARPLIDAAAEILDTNARWLDAGRYAVRDAVARGHRLVDINLIVSDAAVSALRRLLDLTDKIAAHCRAGELLALAPTDELQAFRAWYVDEMERQLSGAPPQPCPFRVAPGSTVGPEEGRREDLGPAARSVLDSLTALLAVADDTEALGRALLTTAIETFGGAHASVCLLADDNESVDIADSIGYPPEVGSHWARFPLSGDLPASEAIRTGEIVVLRTLAERDARYPIFVGTPVLSDPSLVCVPFAHGGPPAPGCLVINFDRSRDFSGRDRTLLAELSATAGSAFARVAAASRDAQHARLRALQREFRAEMEMGAARGADQLVQRLAAALAGRVVDWCSVHVLGADGSARFVAAAHADPAKVPLAEQLYRRWPVRVGAGPIGTVLQSGQTRVFQVVPPDLLPQIVSDPEQADLLQRMGFGSGAVVALCAGSQVAGVIVVADGPGRYFTDAEIRFLEAVGADAGALLVKLASRPAPGG